MVKYDYEVFEKGNTKLRQELVEHAKMVQDTPLETRLAKPETWLSRAKLSYCGRYSPSQTQNQPTSSQAESVMVEEVKGDEVTPIKLTS